jgi:hypothetical protein
MDALSFLARQHRDAEALFLRCSQEDGDWQSFVLLVDLLTAHSSLEERYFYPVLGKHIGTEDQIKAYLREHFEHKQLIADLLDLTPSDPRFQKKLSVLHKNVSSHIAEEEKLFPLLRAELTPTELDFWGTELALFWRELSGGEPHQGTLDPASFS